MRRRNGVTDLKQEIHAGSEIQLSWQHQHTPGLVNLNDY